MELVNPLTKKRLDALRPRPLVKSFSWSDVAGGNLLLGTCPAGYLVDKTIVHIQTEFDGNVQITVGDMVAQARLQAIADNAPSAAGYYEVNNSYEYVAQTDIYVFFPGGSPTVGQGRVLVYLT
jgi:hypothetical protein